MTKAEKVSYFKNPFIGIYISATENFAFVPIDTHDKLLSVIENTLQVKAVKTNVSFGSTLLGIYVRGNSNGVLLPSDSTDTEIKTFKKLGINVAIIDNAYNAMGNLVAVNDHAALINEKLSKDKKEIEDCLGVEVIETELMAGANMVVTNRGLFLNSNHEYELKDFERIFKVRGDVGTANFGVPYVGICILANSKGFLAGSSTSGFEMSRVDEALGFLG